MDLKKGYDRLQQLDDYKNFDRNLDIAKGKSTKVFYQDILKRVKLEHMGAVNDKGLINSYSWNSSEKKFSVGTAKFENLIVGNNILQDVVKIYAEMASDKKPVIETNQEDFINEFQLDTLTGEYVFTNSYGGATLIKGVANQEDKTFSFYDVKRKDFFEIFDNINPKLIVGYVVFEIIRDQDKLIKCEIYTEGKTEYRMFAMGDKWEEQQYPIDLSEFGLKSDGLGYINEYDGWQVAYIPGYSAYNDDLISNVREIVTQDTTTSQAFNKCLNPLLQVPPTMLEDDGKGGRRINVEDRVVIVEPGDVEMKQIQLETNMSEWNIQRENILQNIYVSTGTNENVLGINKNGSSNGSGVSIERSSQRILSVVNYKRNKVYKALEQVLKWGYKEINGADLDLTITGDDILNKSSKEVIEERGLELDNVKKIADIFISLNQSTADVEIQTLANDMKENIKLKLKELGLGGING